jgi:hypothetical protein
MKMEAKFIEPSTLMLILGPVISVWMLTAVILAVAARHHRATLRVHCPLLRRDVEMESDEWEDRLLDVRRCSGLHPSTDFELCGKRCLDLDEFTPLPTLRAFPGSRGQEETSSASRRSR